MKNISFYLKYIIAALVISIIASNVAKAQLFRKKDTTATQVLKKTKKQLLRDNERMSSDIDSLKTLLDEYISRQRHDDSVRSEIIDIFEENEGKIGADSMTAIYLSSSGISYLFISLM